MLSPRPVSAQTLAGAQYLSKFGLSVPSSPGAFDATNENAVDDTNGDVYVVETYRVQVFSSSGMYLRQWVCSSCAGIEVNGDLDAVYVTDTNAHQVRRYTRQGALQNTWGGLGSGPGQFDYPWGIAIDPATNNVYVRDTANARVQVFDSIGTYLFEFGGAGTAPGQFEALRMPSGIAFDPVDRVVYATDTLRVSINKYDAAGNALLRFGGLLGQGLGQMRWPRDVEVDALGRVYVADTDNERIQVFDASGVALYTFQGPHNRTAGPFHPRSIAIHRATGRKFVNAAYAFRVDRFDSDDAFLGSIGNRALNGPYLEDPRGIAVSPLTGDVYVMDSGNYLIKRFSPGGAFELQWGGSSRIGMDQPGLLGFYVDSAITVDPDGDVWKGLTGIHYATDPPSLFIQEADANGNLRAAWPRLEAVGTHYDDWLSGIAIDPASRDVWVTDAYFGRLRRYNAAGAPVLSVPGLSRPAGIAFDAGSVWITLAGSDRIRRYDLNGSLQAEIGGPGTGPGEFNFDDGSAIVVAPNGNLLVADTFNNRVQEVTPQGAFVAQLGSFGLGDGQFIWPIGLAFSPGGELLYVLDGLNDRVQVFCLTSIGQCLALLDADSDGVPDKFDSCAYLPTPQPDTGAVASPTNPGGFPADGIGDGCQCGALDADGDVDAADLAQLRLFLTDQGSVPLERCSVAGGEECDLLDAAAMVRAFAGQYPKARQTCTAAVRLAP